MTIVAAIVGEHRLLATSIDAGVQAGWSPQSIVKRPRINKTQYMTKLQSARIYLPGLGRPRPSSWKMRLKLYDRKIHEVGVVQSSLVHINNVTSRNILRRPDISLCSCDGLVVHGTAIVLRERPNITEKSLDSG